MRSLCKVVVGLAVCSFILSSNTARADLIEFFVTGAQGDGLLPGNIDPPTSSTGSGGIGATGIIFDTDTNILSVDVEWGSENGYSDLTGAVTLLHWHGPTADAPPDNFGQVNPQILINLGNSLQFDSSSTGGSLVDTFFLSNDQEEYLLSGRTYINVHTAAYPMGEIRGYLLPTSAIPEPSSFVVLSATLLLMRRNRQFSKSWQ